LAVAGIACSSGIADDPILVLSSAEALEEGRRLMEEEKYRQARDYLTHAFEVEPNSAGGREALLLAADAYFLQGGEDNYIRAEGKYRDFQTRFPTSRRAAYVQYQIANSLIERLEKPDRDQTATRDALTELHTVIELYPTSEYAEQARGRIGEVRQRLAEHEMAIGYFYLRYRNYNGAKQRLEYLLENFPDYEHRDRALYLLGLTLYKSDQLEESAATFERLRTEYPGSAYIKEIPKA
jgi:outer membrane protein assembly factor BamD